MDQERIAHFSVIKQKIIKTDEILKMYVDVTNKLKKVQQTCKELKFQHDQAVGNTSRIQLEHERCTFSLENLKQRNDILAKENMELQGQKLHLEEQYNQYTVQAQINIKNLQEELKMVQELKCTAQNWSSPKKKSANSKTKIETINKNSARTEKSPISQIDTDHLKESINATDEKYYKCTIDIGTQTLKSEIKRKSVCLQTTETLKTLQLQDEIIAENNQLKQKISECEAEINKLKMKLQANKKEYTNVGTQTLRNEIIRKSVCLQTTETLGTLQLQDVTITENKQLKTKISECEAEINQLTVQHKPLCIKTEVEDYNKSVEDILHEMSFSNIVLLSPMSPAYEDLNLKETENIINSSPCSPTPVVTPTQDIKEQDQSTHSITNNSVRPLGSIQEVYTKESVGIKRNKYRQPAISKEYIKLKKSYLRSLKNKMFILTKEIKRYRKMQKQDHLLKSLSALKHCNINFTISNEAILPQRSNDKGQIDLSNTKSENTSACTEICDMSYVTEELTCLCKKCSHSNMLLSNVNDEVQLLGFYSVKSEVNTTPNSIVTNVWDTKPFSAGKQIRCSENSNKEETSNILEILAEMVSSKLDEKKRNKNKSKRKRITSYESDTFDSETETEIERLFSKTNGGVFKRNKLFLKSYKEQKMSSSHNSFTEHSELNEQEFSDFSSNTDVVPNEDITNFEHTSPLNNMKEPKQNVIEGSFPSTQLLSPLKSVKSFKYTRKKDTNESCVEPNVENCYLNIPPLLSPIESVKNVKCNKINDLKKSLKFSVTDNTKNINILNENFITDRNVDQGKCNGFDMLRTSQLEDDRITLTNRMINRIDTRSNDIDENYTINIVPECIEKVKDSSTEQNDLDISLLSNSSQLHTDNFKSIPDCPESPNPDNLNVGVMSPVPIPLDKINVPNAETLNEFQTSVESLPENETLASVVQKDRRRSKRILDRKRCSKSQTSEGNLDSKEPLPHEKYSFNETVSREASSRISKIESDSAEMQSHNLNDNPISNEFNNETIGNVTVTNPKKRKNVSKMMSKVLRQVRAKQQIFKTNIESNTLEKNSSKSEIYKAQPDNKTSNKIRIVQNILIPANSNHAVDLMSKQDLINCDISLDKEPSSNNNGAGFNSSCTEKIIHDEDCNIRPDGNMHGNLGMECDILSKIMGEMDKTKPVNILKRKENSIASNKSIPDSTDEKQWRKGVLEIADHLHNVSSKPELVDQVTDRYKVFDSKSVMTIKRQILLKRLLKISSDEEIPDEIILEFKRQDVESIVEMILQTVCKDIHDKPDGKYYPAPLMTRTQRILLGLMVRLEQENVENVMDTFLSKVEVFLFKIGCGLRMVIPVIRLYMAVCKLRRDIDKMRNFCCRAFLFMDNLAVPIFFTVLTSWTEVLPMESSVQSYPLAKVLIQIVHLKTCNQPGYNLLPLKFLFSQFYGYPKERWNCDEIFEELFQQYLKNPDKSTDIAIRLLCKHKDSKWVYKKLNEFFKPLIYKIPVENVNFRATAIILIGNLCRIFKPTKEFDEVSLNELRRWLIGLTEDDNVHELIKKSVDISLSKLPRKKMKTKKNKTKTTQQANIKPPRRIIRNKKCKKKKVPVVK